MATHNDKYHDPDGIRQRRYETIRPGVALRTYSLLSV
jgi:hypothetical protein